MKTLTTGRRLLKSVVLACAAALGLSAWASTTYSTDYSVTGSETAYTTSAGNANVYWQNFNFRAAVDKDHLAHGYYFFLKDGDTDIGETDAAVKLNSITLTWGGNAGGAIAASDTPYLVVTTPDDSSPVIIGVSKAGDAFAANGTSTFEFENLVLASNAKYRFYFYKNDVSGLSVGNVLTGFVQGRINGRYHNKSGDARADYNDIRCSGGAGYSINCSFDVSSVTTEATVLKTGLAAVSVSSAASPVVVEGKVADGVVEVGSEATVDDVFTVCGEATTLELTDSLTAAAFYFPATVTIDASGLSGLEPTGDDSSKTTTLLSGRLSYTTAPTVTLPEASAGMIYETNITESGLSVAVVKGVDCVETIAENVVWSAIKPEGWIDSVVGDKPAIAITYEGEEPVTLTFDEAVQAGSLTLAGNIVVEASAAATIGTVSAGAGSVVEMANMTITTQSGSGVYRYRSNYPSAVPNNSLTYEYVGTADSENPGTVNLNGMRGTVRTTGYMSITGYFPLLTNAKLDVVAGTTTLTAGGQAICGYITIREGATLVNTTTDSLAYSQYSSVIDVYGTLDMGSSRWTVWSGATINLRGGEVVGAGEGNNGALDFMGVCNITAYADSAISANVKFRNALSNVTVNDGVTLTISGVTRPGYDSGGITKKGAGILKFTSDPYVPAGITVEEGTLAFDTENDVDPVVRYTASVLSSANMDYVGESNWKGRVVISAVEAGDTATKVALDKFASGNENSYLTLNGISGNAWCAGSNYTVQPEITLAGDVNFQNGYSGKAVVLRKIAAGTGNLSLKSWSNCTGITYGFTTLDADNYTGTIQLDGSVLTFNVGDILKAGAVAGDKVLPLTVANNATVNLAGAKVNGETVALEVKEDGIYIAAPAQNVNITVPAVANTTVAVTAGGVAVSPTTEGGTTYSVPDGAAVVVTYTAVEGYTIEGTASFSFNASEGYTVDTAGTTAAQYVVSMTVNNVTTKYTTLQAALNAITLRQQRVVLLVNETVGATVPAGTYSFYIIPGEFTYGTIAFPEGDYITSITETSVKKDEGSSDLIPAVAYTCAPADIIVTVGAVRSLYSMTDASTAIAAATAGGAGSTVKFVNGGASYKSLMEDSGFEYDSANDIYTLAAVPVAAVYSGQILINNYTSLAGAVAAAEAGQTVKLLVDVTEASAAALSGSGTYSFTLDLAGFTLTGTDGIDWQGSGTLTITDTVGGGQVIATANDGIAVWADGGAIAVAGGYFQNNSTTEATAYVKAGGSLAVSGGTFKNLAQDYAYAGSDYDYYALNVHNISSSLAALVVTGGSFSSNPAKGDDSLGGTFVASGYASVKSGDVWTVVEVQETPVAPGTTTEPVESEAAAQADAAKTVVSVPAAVAAVLTAEQQTAYKALFEAKVVTVTVDETTKYAVTVELTDAAAAAVQTAVDAAASNLAEAAVAAAADAVNGGTATVATTAGLYYVVEAGAEVDAIAPESCTLASGSSLDLTLPNKGAKGFYRLRVSVTPVAVEAE